MSVLYPNPMNAIKKSGPLLLNTYVHIFGKAVKDRAAIQLALLKVKAGIKSIYIGHPKSLHLRKYLRRATSKCRNPCCETLRKGKLYTSECLKVLDRHRSFPIKCREPYHTLANVSMTECPHHPMKIVHETMGTYAYRCCGIPLAPYAKLPSSLRRN
ncbi:hypothetical protein CDAR_16791 [Caerostris darwini]|uniref:Uncharacterized protein n=1 Tax=Caerostris darwini TaxID=1538125 RepID=A0AAV4M6R8_9ARAC|nr:hypothetical protein CDAR_16791 [Caerostris darwini]